MVAVSTVSGDILRIQEETRAEAYRKSRWARGYAIASFVCLSVTLVTKWWIPFLACVALGTHALLLAKRVHCARLEVASSRSFLILENEDEEDEDSGLFDREDLRHVPVRTRRGR